MAFFASGNRVPEFTFGVGCSFRLWLRWETPSHSDCKFRVALSAKPLNRKPHPIPKPNSGTLFPQSRPTIRKARPTLNTSSERMRACRPRRPRHRGDGKCHPKRLPRRGPLSKKASRTSRLSHLYYRTLGTTSSEATRPARPSWRLRPCCPSPPWWDDPLRQPSCRAAT